MYFKWAAKLSCLMLQQKQRVNKDLFVFTCSYCFAQNSFNIFERLK